MPKFNATIHVFHKTSSKRADTHMTLTLHKLNFPSVSGVRIGKCFLISLDAIDEESAKTEVMEMCKKLSAFTGAEEFTVIAIEKAAANL